MDIKTLLLKSLSSKRPLFGSRRIQCGKSCVIVKYVLNANIFNIQAIKIYRRHKTWAQRLKHYKMDLKTYRNKENYSYSKKINCSILDYSEKKQDKETLTEFSNKSTKEVQTVVLKHISSSKHFAMQTIDIQKYAKETQTETPKATPKLKDIFKLGSPAKTKAMTPSQPASLTTTAQQTLASVNFSRNLRSNNKILCHSKATSTTWDHACKAVQCKRSTQTKACITETNTRDSFAQVENDLPTDPHNTLPEQFTQRSPLPAEEFGVFIYMLNEIGETVINQNQILQNNTELIKQIMQLSMLQNSKRTNNSSCSSISTQTDQLLSIEKKNNFSQTATEGTKQRKLLIFKGRRSQVKKTGQANG